MQRASAVSQVNLTKSKLFVDDFIHGSLTLFIFQNLVYLMGFNRHIGTVVEHGHLQFLSFDQLLLVLLDNKWRFDTAVKRLH